MNEIESEKKTERESENSRFVMINDISGQFRHDTVVKKYSILNDPFLWFVYMS